MSGKNAILKAVPAPLRDWVSEPVMLSEETINERLEKVLTRMRERSLDHLVVYCDNEHSGNFEYLVGFFTRFEESLLVLHADGTANAVLGNENLNKASKARIEMVPVLASQFSLPNQPDSSRRPLGKILADVGIAAGDHVGIVGWKLFSSYAEDVKATFDIPAFMLDAVRNQVGDSSLVTNETDIFIGENGARNTNNVNEIAHYEFFAALAGDSVMDAADLIDEGVTELELGDKLARYGQHQNVVTIAASGPRFVNGNMYPTNNTVKVGDTISLSIGLSGGFSSRAAYAVHNASELPKASSDWLERVAMPYFVSYAAWLECVHVGMTGGEVFDVVEAVLPRDEYGWSLCPGHLVAEQEWMCSPVYEGSTELIQSGMLFEIDIIPSVPGYGGVCAEAPVAIADASLRSQIAAEYPEMWARFERRRAYIKNVLGINISEDVLPMCSSVAYMRPFMLDKEKALVISRD